METPSSKVTAAVLAGAVVTFAAYLVELVSAVELPATAAAAATTIVSFVLAYWVPESNPAPSAVETVMDRVTEPET